MKLLLGGLMQIDPVLLYDYTIWANARVLEGARQLTPEQLRTPIRADFLSPFGLLVLLWHLVAHVINHGTEHRSQMALVLAQHSIDVGNLDLIYFLRAEG